MIRGFQPEADTVEEHGDNTPKTYSYKRADETPRQYKELKLRVKTPSQNSIMFLFYFPCFYMEINYS